MEGIWEYIGLFTIIFGRVSAFTLMLPAMGDRSVPPPAKIGLAAFVSILLFSMMKGMEWNLPKETISFILLVAKEVFIGLVLGFTTKFIIASVQMAGEVVGVQIGFGVARVVDPGFQSQISIVAEFQVFFVILLYLTLDGHHFLLKGLFQSYQGIPVAHVFLGEGMVSHVVQMASTMFRSAVKIGAPVIVALLLTNMALGIIARTVPQMNVFIIGLPLRLIVGFLALAVTMTLFLHVFRSIWTHFQRDFVGLIHLF